MKKYLLSVFAAASMLFAASCSEEENFAESNKQSVTFKVEVEDAGASSRALSNRKDVGQGSLVNKVYYAVYEADGGEFLTSGNAVMTPTANGTVGSVVIPLVNGLPFDIVFFAHHEKENNDVNESAFIIPDNGDLTELRFNTNLKANQESYDAFYNTLPGFQTTNNSTTPVKLTRAVAQLNVGTTEADLSYADALKALATMSKITLTNVPTKFNARTGEVDDRANVTFDASNILMDANWVDKPYKNEILKDVKTNDVVKDFYYLAMAYVLAGDESALHDATFTFYRGEGDNIEAISERSLSSVRLQRNYRTNVTGNVLTQQEKFDVSLDINFGNEEHNYSVGDVVVVAKSEDLQAAIENAQPNVPVEIQLEDNITLDGSWGRAASGPNNQNIALFIKEGNTIILDLNGCTLSTPLVDGSVTNHLYAFENHGSLIIKDTDGDGAIKARGIYNYGNMTLESGTIDAVDGNGGYGIRNYEGAEFTMNGGSIITSYEDDDAPESGNYDATTLRVDENAKAIINGGIINNTQNYTFAIDNSGETTVNGGTFTSIHSTVSSYGTLTINDGSFTCNGIEGITAHCLVTWENSETTINGGTFDGKDNYNGFNVDASEGATVYIKGGKFLSVHSGSLYGKGIIVVTGGNFFDEVAENRLANGYYAVKQNDNTYTIVADNSLQADIDNATNGATITLDANVALPESLVIPEGKTLTLDLNNYTIEGPSVAKDAEGNRIHVIVNNGTLTIKNGTVKSIAVNGGSAIVNNGTMNVVDVTLNGAPNANGSWPSYTVNNTGIMTIENTKITSYHGSVASYNANATVTLKNSEIDMTGIPGFTNHGIYTYNGGSVIVNGGTYTNNATDQASTGGSIINGSVTVNSGTFTGRIENYSGTPVLNGGTYSVNPKSNFIGEGCRVVQTDDNTWTVVKPTVVTDADGFISAINDRIGMIVLANDIVLPAENMDSQNSAALYIDNVNATIDLNNKTLKAGQSDRQKMFYIAGGSDVTIMNGKLEIISTNGQVTGTGTSTGGSSAVYCSSANITMKDVEIIGSQRGGHRAIEVYNGKGKFENITINVNHGLGINAGAGAETTLTNCNITVNGMYSAPYNSTCFSVMGGGQMSVNSGNYKLVNDALYSTGNTHGGWVGIIMSSGGTLNLNGGTFTNVPAEGFNPQYERPLFSSDAVSGKESLLNFNGGTYVPQEDQIVHKGGSGGTENVAVKGEIIGQGVYSVNQMLLEKMTNDGKGTWSIK